MATRARSSAAIARASHSWATAVCASSCCATRCMRDLSPCMRSSAAAASISACTRACTADAACCSVSMRRVSSTSICSPLDDLRLSSARDVGSDARRANPPPPCCHAGVRSDDDAPALSSAELGGATPPAPPPPPPPLPPPLLQLLPAWVHFALSSPTAATVSHAGVSTRMKPSSVKSFMLGPSGETRTTRLLASDVASAVATEVVVCATRTFLAEPPPPPPALPCSRVLLEEPASRRPMGPAARRPLGAAAGANAAAS